MLCHWLMILLMNFWFWLPLTRASTIKRRLCDLPWLKSVVFPLFNRCYFKCMHFVFISSYLIASFRSAVLAFLCTSHIANMLKGCEWKSKRKTMILFILTGYRLDWKCNSKHRIISGKIGKRKKERKSECCVYAHCASHKIIASLWTCFIHASSMRASNEWNAQCTHIGISIRCYRDTRSAKDAECWYCMVCVALMRTTFRVHFVFNYVHFGLAYAISLLHSFSARMLVNFRSSLNSNLKFFKIAFRSFAIRNTSVILI